MTETGANPVSSKENEVNVIYVEGTVVLVQNEDGTVSVCDNGEEVLVVGLDKVDTMEKAEALAAEFVAANNNRNANGK